MVTQKLVRTCRVISIIWSVKGFCIDRQQWKILNYFSLFQPPICDANGENVLKKRRKRQTLELDENRGLLYDTDREDLKVKVYRGLYVSEASDFDDAFIDDETPTEVVSFLIDMLYINVRLNLDISGLLDK